MALYWYNESPIDTRYNRQGKLCEWDSNFWDDYENSYLVYKATGERTKTDICKGDGDTVLFTVDGVEYTGDAFNDTFKYVDVLRVPNFELHKTDFGYTSCDILCSY